MWLMTKQGFYSSVAHRGNPDIMLIRTRAREDLEALEAQLPGVSDRIYSDQMADYLYRVELTRGEWVMVLARISGEVDYDNFKSAVAREMGSERAHVYHRCWDALTRIERGFARRYYGRWTGGHERGFEIGDADVEAFMDFDDELREAGLRIDAGAYSGGERSRPARRKKRGGEKKPRGKRS